MRYKPEILESVKSFVDDACEPVKGAKIRSADLYDAYVKHCEGAGHRTVGNRIFPRVLNHFGYTSKSNGKSRFVSGLTLKGKAAALSLDAAEKKRRRSRKKAGQGTRIFVDGQYQPPEGLTQSGLDMWDQIVATYGQELEYHGYAILANCCQLWDVFQKAKKELAAYKTVCYVSESTGNHVPYPQVKVMLDTANSIMRSFKEMGLSYEELQ